MSFAAAAPGGPAGRWAGFGVAIAYLAAAAAVGLYRVGETGALWPDAPRYANAGAMVRDWFHSGQWLSPLRFAESNYARYPAFSVPYHPPGVPAALGTWFLLTGVSYESARVFVALCWGLAGWLFYRINRELGFDRSAAFASGLVLLSTPQLATWARDTMSEVPSLAPLFGATLFWLRWLRTNRARDGLLALGLAEVAFFFRVTTAGVLPGLVLFGAVTGGWTRRRFLAVAAAGVAYVVVNAAWVMFAQKYATHEMSADGKGSVSLRAAIDYFAACLPGIVAGGTAALAAVGLAVGPRTGETRRALGFWLAWLASYTAFKVAVPTTPEVRHFLTALPALAGLSAAVFPSASPRGRVLAWALVSAAVAANLWVLADCPRGVVGYQAVGEALARCDRPGNVLVACREDQDLIFRYRAANPTRERYLLRSDRTLAVRVSDYAGVPARVLAHSDADVLELIRKGRVRYVVTSAAPADRPDEMRLVDTTARAHPELFRPVGVFVVAVEYVDHIHPSAGGEVWVWEFVGPVEDGPPDLPVVVPTAGLVIRP
jgi:hypothetical protein